MSKAFTRESDDDRDDAPLPVRSPLPLGTRNYITPQGAQRLREELAALEAAVKKGPGSRGRDARLKQLMEIVPTLVVAEAPAAEREVIRFGASVKVLRAGVEESYRIVGVDETDIDRNEISWLSPFARALIGRRRGETIRFRSAAGNEPVEILGVSY